MPQGRPTSRLTLGCGTYSLRVNGRFGFDGATLRIAQRACHKFLAIKATTQIHTTRHADGLGKGLSDCVLCPIAGFTIWILLASWGASALPIAGECVRFAVPFPVVLSTAVAMTDTASDQLIVAEVDATALGCIGGELPMVLVTADQQGKLHRCLGARCANVR